MRIAVWSDLPPTCIYVIGGLNRYLICILANRLALLSKIGNPSDEEGMLRRDKTLTVLLYPEPTCWNQVAAIGLYPNR